MYMYMYTSIGIYIGAYTHAIGIGKKYSTLRSQNRYRYFTDQRFKLCSTILLWNKFLKHSESYLL